MVSLEATVTIVMDTPRVHSDGAQTIGLRARSDDNARNFGMSPNDKTEQR